MEGVVSLRRYQFSLRPYPDLIFFPGGTSVRDTCSFPVSKRPEAEVSHRKAHPFRSLVLGRPMRTESLASSFGGF